LAIVRVYADKATDELDYFGPKKVHLSVGRTWLYRGKGNYLILSIQSRL